MLCHCYLRKGIVYIPTLAKIEPEAGYRNIEPVSVVPVSDSAALRRAFRETIAKGNPTVPVLPRANQPKPVMLKYVGLKSWNAFERSTLTWMMEEREGVYRIIGHRRRADRGWEQDPNQIVMLPPGSGVDEVIDRMVAILQAAGRE